MRKSLYSAILAVFTFTMFSISSMAAPGDLFVVVDLNDESACSVLKVNPVGNLSEFLTDFEIRQATGLEEATCDNVGLTCDLNGEIYFSEGFSDDDENDQSRVLLGGPAAGNVSLFTPNSSIIAATGDTESDLDKGLTLGPDGNLYAADETTDSVLQITVPGSVVSVVVTEAQIEAATGENNANLEGGIAVDPDLNILIADEESDSIVSCSLGGPCSVLTTEEQFENAAGVGDVELDEQILLVGDLLYVAEDTDCDCIFVLDINNGIPEVFLSEEEMEAVLGGEDAEPEGGLAVDSQGRIYVGNTTNSNRPSILRTGPDANKFQLSLFVSSDEVLSFYSDFFQVDFDANICVTPVIRTQIPTLSEWSMLAMAGVLGVIGLLFAIRRRALSS